MTTPRDDLKKYFSDGSLPTGANFAELIDSMVHQDAFAAHIDGYEPGAPQEVMVWDSQGRAWRLSVNATGHVGLDLQSADGPEPEPTPGPDACRWVAGTAQGGVIAKAGPTPCAFKVTAGTAESPGGTTGMSRFFRWLVGIPHPSNSLLEACVAPPAGPDAKPIVTEATEVQRAWRSLWGQLLTLVVVASPLVVVAFDLAFPTNTLHVRAAILPVLLILVAARQGNAIRVLKRRGVKLAWKKAEDAGAPAWDLHLLGPADFPDPDIPQDQRRIYYRVTKLWP